MKKSSFILSLAVVAVILLASCGKGEQVTIQKTMNFQLQPNEEFSFVLPESMNKNAYEFSTQASHYSISSLTKTASGEQVYTYIPQVDYTGFDHVVVENNRSKGDQPNGPFNCPGGPCGQPVDEEYYSITMNFEIGREADNAVVR